jgi:hypothetical protein
MKIILNLVYCGIASICLMASAGINTIYTQTDLALGTFNECYQNWWTSNFYAFSAAYAQFGLNGDIHAFMNDPRIIQYVTDTCNFYHEKTGQWILPRDIEVVFTPVERDQLTREFNQKYGFNPEDLMKLMYKYTIK